jgi:hypothetical protein
VTDIFPFKLVTLFLRPSTVNGFISLSILADIDVLLHGVHQCIACGDLNGFISSLLHFITNFSGHLELMVIGENF